MADWPFLQDTEMNDADLMAIFSAVASSILNGFESRDREKISDGRLYVEVVDNPLGVIGINSKLKEAHISNTSVNGNWYLE